MFTNTKIFNKDYSRISIEIYLFIKIKLLKFNKPTKKVNSILIVNTCLIGEFISSLFAIESFIKDSEGSVDMIVSPLHQLMAERIVGIGNVYVAKSNYKRKSEDNESKNKKELGSYKKIIVLRPSKDVISLIKDIRTERVETSLKYFIFYGLHLFKSLIFRKTPKQWKNLNFEMLNTNNKNLGFDDIFRFSDSDFEKIKRLKEMETKERIILFHVNSDWVMKSWKLENWIKLLNNLKQEYRDYRFIFIGTKKDTKTFEEIKLQLNFKIYSLINKIDLKDLLLVMRRSHYFIGIDSGPTNMAHLCDLRSITIMGPGPHMYLPYNKLDFILDKSGGRGFYQMFFKKRNKFIDKISADEVFLVFKKLSDTCESLTKLDKKFFSIIVPAHNEEKIIKNTLIYLKNLAYPRGCYEVIVIENGSTDKTYDIAENFKSENFKVFHSIKKGVSRARNFGVQKLSSKSQWVLFLDADTFLKSGFLNELNDYLCKFPKVTYGTTYITPFPNTLKHKLWYFFLINWGDFIFKYLHRIHIVKKSHLFRIRYDEEISSTEDLKFSRDLAKDGGKYFFLLTRNVLNSTRRWNSEGYLKPYMLSFYHSFLNIFNKKKLKKQKWKIIR